MKKKIKLVCNQQIGDCIKTTTVAKLFKEQYPEYDIEVAMSHPVVYKNNPNVINNSVSGGGPINAATQEESKCIRVVCNQDDDNGAVDNKYSIHKLKENDASFLQGMVGYINAKYGFNLQITEDKPDIYLSEEEKKPIEGLPTNYWVVNAGSEHGNTRKMYPREYWEKFFNMNKDMTFVQTGVTKDNHKPYENCKNVINRLDKDNVRETLRLIYHSKGVVTPVSFTMHAAAAWHKPCIAIAGGGEDVCWENYKYGSFNYIHTIGSLDCCNSGGCWKATCDNLDPDTKIQKCMKLITPEFLTDVIKQYK